MNILRTLIVSLACLLSIEAYAQQSPVFSDYNYNTMIVNSAYTGFNPDTEIFLSNTGFFNSIEGSPKTLRFNVQTAINSNKMGLGAGFSQDEIGVTSVTNMFASYSYKIFFDLKNDRPHYEFHIPTVLSFGATAGLQIYNDNLLSLGIDDDVNFGQNINAKVPTLGFGILFNNDRFYAGLSSPNLLGDKLANEDALQLKSTFYSYLGYRIFTNNFREILIKPNVLFKYENGAPLQADINTAVNYKNKFEIGVGYRTTSSMNFLIGIYMVKHMRLIYHYNQPFTDNPIKNSHGLSLSYRFGDGYSK